MASSQGQSDSLFFDAQPSALVISFVSGTGPQRRVQISGPLGAKYFLTTPFWVTLSNDHFLQDPGGLEGGICNRICTPVEKLHFAFPSLVY